MDPKKDASNWNVLKSFREMLIELDFKSFEYYQTQFETPFLQELSKHYYYLGEKNLAENNLNNFIETVMECINQQKTKYDKCFDAMSSFKINSILQQYFILPYTKKIMDIIINKPDYTVKNDGSDDLKLLHELLIFSKTDTSIMANAIIKFMRDQSETLIECNNPLEYIESHLKDKFYYFLSNNFSDTKFKNKIRPHFMHFINRNPRCPEFLSLYFDEILKQQNVMNIDTDIDKAVMLYKYLEEKDVFEKFYKIHLAKRLLYANDHFADAEKAMIYKLKTECGIFFISKLEGMIKDIEASNTFMNSYRKSQYYSEVDISVNILNQFYWPISQANVCHIPISEERTFNNFKIFYLQKYKDRVITLNPCMGSAEIKAIFYKKIDGSNQFREETKILIVSTYQMCILMAFNERDSYTYNELMEYTKVQDRDLKKAFMSLCKPDQQILKLEGASLEDGKNGNDIFSVNDDFSSNLTKIRIKQVSNKNCESDFETKDTLLKNDAERKWEIEAAILRIMKLHQKLNHNELVTEIIKQMNHQFNPDLFMIKMRIESLIEREYLKRNEIDSRYYCYVA